MLDGALANMALAKLYGGQADEALRLMTMAFVEDALSKADDADVGRPELHMLAAHNLVYVFAVPGPYIANAGQWVRNVVASGRCVQDPEELMNVNPLKGLREVALAVGPPLPGRFLEPWERRVFIGGSYDATEVARLKAVQAEVDATPGFRDVLVADYVIPDGMSIRDHALMLLHECGVAVFDLSARAGQMVEFDRVFEYAIHPSNVLLVYDAALGRPAGGAMASSVWEKYRLDPVPYGDLDELRTRVRSFLAGLATP